MGFDKKIEEFVKLGITEFSVCSNDFVNNKTSLRVSTKSEIARNSRHLNSKVPYYLNTIEELIIEYNCEETDDCFIGV